MSEWLIQTFLRSLPLMWQRRFTPSKHMASNLPFPNILVTYKKIKIKILNCKLLRLYLGILLAVLLEDQLPLQPLVLVLPPPPVLSSLSFIFRHFVFLFLNHLSNHSLITVLVSATLFSLSSGRNRGLGVTRDYLHTVNLRKLGVLSEFNLLQHEGPHVVAEPVRVQFLSLKAATNISKHKKDFLKSLKDPP